MSDSKIFGFKGEEKAVNYLKNNGYKILERNYRGKFGEIDIIAYDEDFLVCIEVKTRSGTRWGSGSEAVTAKKLRSVIKTFEHYLQINKKYLEKQRVDVLEIYEENEFTRINHIKNVTI